VRRQGVKGPGHQVPRTYSEQELLPFLEAFEVLFEPQGMERAPIGRSLGTYAGMVGLPLGEFLHAVTGVEREAMIASATLTDPVTFESMDTADLHVICGGLTNAAEFLCSSDKQLPGYDPIAQLRVRAPSSLAQDLGLIGSPSSPAQVPLLE
jgi:hypothetical protein